MIPIHRYDVPAPTVPLSAGYRAGDFLFVSGQVATQADGSILLGEFDDEVNLTLDNVAAILDAGGADFSKVVKINAWLSNAALFGRFNELYAERFSSVPPPARTTVVVAFGNPHVRVEVDAIAYLGE